MICALLADKSTLSELKKGYINTCVNTVLNNSKTIISASTASKYTLAKMMVNVGLNVTNVTSGLMRIVNKRKEITKTSNN